MSRRRSRAELEMEAQLRTLDPSSMRYVTLSSARDYKVAWISLGQHLTVVREQEKWAEWGYASFEMYCRRELKIRKDTANKLTRSFSYLRDHEPGRVDTAPSELRELPSLDVVDLLSSAKDRSQLGDQDLHQIHQEVFDDARHPPNKNQLLKRFREIDPDAFRNKPSTAQGPQAVRKALLLAERLAELLQTESLVSGEALRGVTLTVSELQKRLTSETADTAEAEADVALVS